MESENTILTEKIDQSRKCENCDNDYKYKCPACNTKSCSLECIKNHKLKTGCDGNSLKKHIEKNISINQYNINDMWKDYSFLEDVRRVLNTSRNRGEEKYVENQTIQQNFGLFSSLRRGIGEHGRKEKMEEEQKIVTVIKESNKFSKHSPIPLLKKACNIRKIKISFCPINEMQIRRNNTTYYNKKDDLLLWKMEFSIYEDKNLIEKKNLDNVSENEIVSQVILKLINNIDYNRIKNVLLMDNFKDESNKVLQEINLNKSFKDNLIGKNIIEFPRFKVEIYNK